MSIAKYTKGPWEFREYAGGCIVVGRHDEPGTTVRARLKGVTVKVDLPERVFIRDDQSNAHEAPPDARLIVAAPDLLEALQALLAAVKTVPEMNDKRFDQVGIQVNAAITKATAASPLTARHPNGAAD